MPLLDDVTVVHAEGGTQTAGGLTFQEGTVTLSGGTLSLNGSATADVGILRSATINSVISGAAGFTSVTDALNNIFTAINDSLRPTG